jgi:hypothetical protein
MAAVATMKPDANAAPLVFWQSRQWQLRVNTGAADHV